MAATPAFAASDTWFVEAVTQQTGRVAVKHFWIKGRKVRLQEVIGGVIAEQLVNGDSYYAIDGLHGEGVVVARSDSALALDRKGGRPVLDLVSALKARGGEKKKTERLAGHDVVVWQLTTDKLKQTIWVTNDDAQLLIKNELTMKGDSEVTFFNWMSDVSIPDAFFEPDPRWKLDRMTAAEYLDRSKNGPVGSVPIVFSDLAFGPK